MSGVQEAVYGSWRSPISSKLATESSVSFQELHLDRTDTDTVYWTEMRYDEGGRYVICSAKLNQPGHASITPADFSARTRVHEYGGGAFLVHDSKVYFTNFSDQRLYVQENGGEPEVLTAEDAATRHADGEFHPKNGRIYAVCEDHSLVEKKEAKEPANTVVVIDPKSGQQKTLASGCDFYSSPRVSPDGKKLAWVQWDHPNMPWDNTELWTAELNEAGDAVIDGTAKKVAGNEDSVMHPCWTPDNELLYISDQTEWWNIYHITSDGSHVNLMPTQAEFHFPHWEFAFYSYDIDPSGSGNVAVWHKQELGILNIKTKEYKKLETGFADFSHVQFSQDGSIYCVAGSPSKFPCVIRVTQDSQVTILRESKSVPVDKGYISVPREISWKTANGEISYGNFYLPQNKDFSAPQGTLPPLLVQVHGGPTAQTSTTLCLKKQYFTSRGFAILDVNYRGSTGYGRSYRHRLRGQWGVCDVEDCSSGAKHLADTDQVDGDKLCIDGGSAGGYTTLACLAFTDVFKGGASHYGVSDVFALAMETHKFESRYMDSIIAPPTPENRKIYDERSPIHHIDSFKCPLILFQGDEDKIVPPNQAEMMFNAVKEKGIPCAFVLFKGEQHGFRKAENIQKALDGEFYFFSKVFGFEAADQHCKLDIENLK